MYKNIVSDMSMPTYIIIEKNGVHIATFYGMYGGMLGQIDTSQFKSMRTKYDMNKREKTIILEV